MDETSLLTVGAISLLGAISPGPDFFVVLRNSLSFSRKIGFITILGIAVGLLFHLFYSIFGVGALISKSPFAFNLIKYGGAAYLFYLGLKSFISSFKKGANFHIEKDHSSLLKKAAFKQGFFTNLLNPKATLFFVSFFSQFITKETPLLMKLEYGAVNLIASIGWFFLFAYFITLKNFTSKLDRFRVYIDRLFGILLILLSIKILL